MLLQQLGKDLKSSIFFKTKDYQSAKILDSHVIKKIRIVHKPLVLRDMPEKFTEYDRKMS